MKLSSRIKPISYLKAHAAEIVRTLGDRQEPLDHHPERRSQGGYPGYQQLRTNAGDRCAAQDSRAG